MKNQAKEEEKEEIGRLAKLTGVTAHGRETSGRSSGGGPTAVGGQQRAWEGEEEKEGIGRSAKLTGVAAQDRRGFGRSIGGGPTAVGGRQRAWEGEEKGSSGEGERREERRGKK